MTGRITPWGQQSHGTHTSPPATDTRADMQLLMEEIALLRGEIQGLRKDSQRAYEQGVRDAVEIHPGTEEKD